MKALKRVRGVRMPEVEASPGHPMEQFFDGLRTTRRERYAGYESPAVPRKRRAVQTIVHNESVFLPIWLRYYSRFFAPDDIYVLDNDTTDGSTGGGGFVRIPVEHESVDHAWMVKVLGEHQAELFGRYDAVLTTDVDEIVSPRPECGGLDQYIERMDEEYVNCLGYEILHMRDREPAYDPRRPVLDQRRFWFANDGYDKPALATRALGWEPGLHTRSGRRMHLDPDLILVHLHRMDYEICRARHRHRDQRAWNSRDVTAGWAKHNLLTGGRQFDRWFYEDSSFEDRGIHIVVETIPEAWRGVV